MKNEIGWVHRSKLFNRSYFLFYNVRHVTATKPCQTCQRSRRDNIDIQSIQKRKEKKNSKRKQKKKIQKKTFFTDDRQRLFAIIPFGSTFERDGRLEQ